MAKGKLGSKTNPLTVLMADQLAEGIKPRGFKITEASIKDDFCNYKYEVTEKIGMGDKHDVKGQGIVKDSLKDAFAKLHVHLAHIDDAFKNSGTDVTDIDKMHNHDLAFLYNVTGFKVKGTDDDMSVILSGSKHVSVGGRIHIETPKVVLDNLSGYKWYNELKSAVLECQEEVAMYREGNYIPVEESSDEPDPAQTKMEFGDSKHEVGEFEDAEM
ncbi:MAG TPA: hypothetical protein PLS87_11285 [Ferruginibacter sp.]|nr:hypothetical protein [Ferruginibacter sp.]HRO97627.1 hypothetical protein [Ferruginibacter sp.]